MSDPHDRVSPMTPHTADPRVDRSRSAVYLAEDDVARALDSPLRRFQLDGELLSLPTPLHFGTVAAMQDYTDSVLSDPAIRAAYPGVASVRVVPTRGFRRASYQDGVIRIPAKDRRGQWAMRDTVLLHEVAHHLAPGGAHGPIFRTALVALYGARLGRGPALLLQRGFAHLEGLPDPDSAAPSGGSDQLRRVAALLAKAESTAHQEEAEAYLARAAMIAQRHSIDLAVAALGSSRAPESPTHRMISIGEPRKAFNTRLVSLLSHIARPWAVRVNIGPSSTYVIVFGMPSDLDQVESVYATASTMMVTHAEAHVRGGSWRGSTYLAADGRRKPVTAAVARNAFCVGFTERLGERLSQSQEQARREASAAQRSTEASSGGRGTGRDARSGSSSGGLSAAEGSSLAPRGPGDPQHAVAKALEHRAAEVTQYYRRTSTARGTWRGGGGMAWTAAGSRAAGNRAAELYGAKRLGGDRRALGA